VYLPLAILACPGYAESAEVARLKKIIAKLRAGDASALAAEDLKDVEAGEEGPSSSEPQGAGGSGDADASAAGVDPYEQAPLEAE
jgi:hypothetical protein